jgi:hypothetical protein
MISNEFTRLLAPFRQLSNKSALAVTYRSLELSGFEISGAARHGMMAVQGDFGIPEGPPIYVDANTFISILGSLPKDHEVELNLEDGGVLGWACGSAKGRLALLKIPEMPHIEPQALDSDASVGWKPTVAFAEALRLGMLSCGNESLASIGAYGVVLDNTGDLCVYSSDNVTISSAFLEDSKPIDGPPTLTFSPEALGLLATVMNPKNEQAGMAFTEQHIYYVDESYRLLIKQIAPLKINIGAVFERFTSSDIMVEIPRDRITAFIKRISAISESKATTILIGASKGKLNMSFSDGLASSEEYYLVDELEVPDLPPIELDAAKIARALAHTTHIVLDYIGDNVLILQGADPIFQYIISGKKGN